MDILGRTLTRLGTWTAHPAAIGMVAFYAALWFIFDRESLDWHAGAALATWIMTLVIQRSEHRDTQAIHAKLDELLKANGEADNELSDIDDEEPEEIERHRTDAAA